MPLCTSTARHFSKRDRIGREPVEWSEASKTPVGGFFSYVVPVGWFVFCIYCISSFLGSSTFISSTTIVSFQTRPLDQNFYLPKLTCIAPKGCYISPMIKQLATGDVEILRKICFDGQLSVKQQRRPPPESPTFPPAENDTDQQELTTDPPVTKGTDVEAGRQCFFIPCGEAIEGDMLQFYYDFNGLNGFFALWSNATEGLAYRVPYLNDVSGEESYAFVKLSQGITHLSLVHKNHVYYRSEIFQYLPIPLPVDQRAFNGGVQNACCLQRSVDINSQFITAASGTVNCTDSGISQLFIRPMPTYTEQSIHSQFIWGRIIGTAGGGLALFYFIGKCCTEQWKLIKTRKEEFSKRRQDPGNRTRYSNDASDLVHHNQLKIFAPEVGDFSN